MNGGDGWIIEEFIEPGSTYDRARAVFKLTGNRIVQFTETYRDGVRTVGDSYVFVAAPGLALPPVSGVLPEA